MQGNGNAAALNIKYSLNIGVGLFGQRFFVDTVGLGQLLQNVLGEGRLIALATHGDRSHVRSVGLDDDAV